MQQISNEFVENVSNLDS